MWSFQRLPIDAVPDITNVQVQINTEAPGYSPLEAEQRITFPVETALYGLPNLSYTRSLSRYGLSQVTVVFEEGTDIYFARNLINERLGAIKSALPPGLEPEMGPIATGLGEIFMYTVEALPGATQADGSPLDATALREIQDWIIKPQLAQVPGVIEVNTIGGYDKQYHVTPSPQRLLEFGITVDELVSALRANNTNRGAGYIERNGQQLLVRSPGQLTTIGDIEQVVIANRDGVPVRVADVAEVAIGKELRTGAATRDGKETVMGTAMMLVGKIPGRWHRRWLKSWRPFSLPARRRQGGGGIRPHSLGGQGDCHGGEEPARRGAAGDRGTISVARQSACRFDNRSGDPLVHACHYHRHGAVWRIRQFDEPGGAGLRPDRRRRGHHRRELYPAPVPGPAPGSVGSQGTSAIGVRGYQRSDSSQPFWCRHHYCVVYLPIFALTGVEGKMFHPMAATVVMALLAAMVLSLTVVPAAVAVFMGARSAKRKAR